MIRKLRLAFHSNIIISHFNKLSWDLSKGILFLKCSAANLQHSWVNRAMTYTSAAVSYLIPNIPSSEIYRKLDLNL